MRRTTLLKLIGIFSAVRGYNIVIVCLAQYLAAIFVLSHKPWREVIFDDSLLMLVIAGALAIAGGYIINGFYDKEKDLINKPTKTMIDHLVSQNTKLTLYFLLNFLSVIVASYVSFRAVIFFSGYIFTMWLYSHRIKKLLFSIESFARSKRAFSPPDSIPTDFLTSSPENRKAPRRLRISVLSFHST